MSALPIIAGVSRIYPRFITSIEGERKQIENEAEWKAMGPDWYFSQEEYIAALEAATKPKKTLKHE